MEATVMRAEDMRVLNYDDLKGLGIKTSRVHLRRLEMVDQFPKRFTLGPARIAWLESEVRAWLQAKVAQRGGVVAPAT